MIDRKMVLYYLQSKYEDDVLKQQIDEMIPLVEQTADFKVCYQQYDKNDAIIQEKLLIGNDIQLFLKDCDNVIVMVATLGLKVDKMIKTLKIKDIGKAYVFQACANVLIEQLCDAFYEQLSNQYQKQGFYLSDRFACGYQDYPLTCQKEFVDLLDTTKRIGVYVNDHSLLVPSKSMSALIGISKKMQPMKIRGCAFCLMKDRCEFRKVGTRCG